MGFISPINKRDNNNSLSDLSRPADKKVVRAIRSDKLHPIKFPVDDIMKMDLKSFYRIAKHLGMEDMQQEEFNTLLLRYGLENLHLVSWDWDYKDTKVYRKTKLRAIYYESTIGGPHGLSVQKGLSDRKIVTFIIKSILKWLKGAGGIEKIIEQP